MPHLPDLLTLPITVDTLNYNDAVISILTTLKPDWKPSSIKIERMTEGFVNLLLLCWPDENKSQKLMVRVFGENKEMDPCFNRDSEINVMRVLAHEKIITPVFCRFVNGVVYGYAPGSTFGISALRDKSRQRLICESLHQVHGVDLSAYLGEVPRPGFITFTDTPWEIITANDYTQIEEQQRYKEAMPPLLELQKQQTEMHALYDALSTEYRSVYCHADLHTHNMVYDKETDSVKFIDWEGGSYCPEIVDITVMFDRQPSAEVSVEEFSTEECRRELLETYLSTHPTHGQYPISKQLLDQWHRGSVRASMVSCFNITSFCLACIKTSTKEADFLGFAILFYQKFLRFKKEAERIEVSP